MINDILFPLVENDDNSYKFIYSNIYVIRRSHKIMMTVDKNTRGRAIVGPIVKD